MNTKEFTEQLYQLHEGRSMGIAAIAARTDHEDALVYQVFSEAVKGYGDLALRRLRDRGLVGFLEGYRLESVAGLRMTAEAFGIKKNGAL